MLHTFTGHQGKVHCVCTAPDGDTFFSGGEGEGWGLLGVGSRARPGNDRALGAAVVRHRVQRRGRPVPP